MRAPNGQSTEQPKPNIRKNKCFQAKYHTPSSQSYHMYSKKVVHGPHKYSLINMIARPNKMPSTSAQILPFNSNIIVSKAGF